MDLERFKKDAFPKTMSLALQALWLIEKGEWEAAHNAAQDDDSADGAWVHAYLHRHEGDEMNARYWYKQADKPFPSVSLEAEWEELTETLLSR